jgi:hypothetical protein
MNTTQRGESLFEGCELFTGRGHNVVMRWLAILLLSTSCGSSSGLVSQTIEGGPGQPITVDINAVDNSVSLEDRDGSRQYAVEIEVGNDSGALVTVTQISIRPDGPGAFQVSPSFQKFNELIDPGKDHVFEMKVWGRKAREWRLDEPRTVTLQVMVTLSNGDTYSYTFEGPVHDTR